MNTLKEPLNFTQPIFIVVSEIMSTRAIERSAWPDIDSATDHLNWMKENYSAESRHRIICVEGGGRFAPTDAFVESRERLFPGAALPRSAMEGGR